MRFGRVLRAGVVVAAASLALAACADEELPGGTSPGGEGREVAGKACTEGSGEAVTIGTKFDQPGLGLETPDGMDGFDVAVACYVAKEVYGDDVKVEFKESPSAERENMIEKGDVDLIFATYTINDERKQKVSFAGPYFLAHQDLLVRSDYEDIKSEDDLKGADLKLCSVTGSTSAENVKKDFAPKANLVEQKGYSECVTALENKEVDAITTDDTILAGLAAANLEDGKPKFKLVGLKLSDEPYGVGMKKGDTELQGKVNEAITKMIEDGSWKGFVDTHLGPAGYEAPEPPAITEK